MSVLCLSATASVSAQTAEVVIGTRIGETAKMVIYPTPANAKDSVYVDWGDGKRKAYYCGGFLPKVEGNVIGDTVKILSDLKKLEISGQKVFSLSMSNESNLKLLNARNNLLEDILDFSGAANLEDIDLANNNIPMLNLTALKNLVYFTIDGNPNFTTAVFAQGNENMRQISMNNCDIVHFYPISLPKLTSLSIRNGSLRDIEIGANYPALSTLELSGNTGLAELDVTQAEELAQLDLNNTNISALNLAMNKKLNRLSAAHTLLEKIDLKNNKQLRTLNLANTKLEKLNLSGLDVLQNITIDSTEIARIDLSDKKYLSNVSARNTGIEFLDMHEAVGYNLMKTIDIRDCKNMTAQTINFTFTAAPFHKGISRGKTFLIAGSNGEHSDPDLLPEGDEDYYKLDVEGDGTASMDSVNITRNDAEGGTYKLMQMDASESRIFSWKERNSKVVPGFPIKVVANAAEGNAFKGVEVNGKLYTDSIFVVSADATIAPVFAENKGNNVIKLTVQTGTPQQYFLAADNPDTKITVDWGDGEPVVYTLGTSLITVANDEGTTNNTVTITGPVTYADFSSYPGFGNDNKITAIDITGNSNLRGLKTYMNAIENLNVSNEKNLEILDCAYCDLSDLDVTNNTILKQLSAYGNTIENLNLKSNTELNYLDVKHNWLSELDLSQNPLLMYLAAQNNDIENLNVADLNSLAYFYAQNNYLKEIDLTNNKELVELNVSDNYLTKLDLTYNTKLESVLVMGNKLEGLDLSNQKDVNLVMVSRNGWNADQLNALYTSLPKYVASKREGSDQSMKTRLWVMGNSTSENLENEATIANSKIATDKGWIIDVKGDGTGGKSTGIAEITLSDISNNVAEIYNAAGVKLNAPTKGLNIFRMKDGSTRKVMMK